MSGGQQERNNACKTWRGWNVWPHERKCKYDHGGNETDDVVKAETEHQAEKFVISCNKKIFLHDLCVY